MSLQSILDSHGMNNANPWDKPMESFAPWLRAAHEMSDEEFQFAHQESLKVSRESLLAFTRYTHHDYRINWHHRLIAAKLDAFVRGDIKRLIVACPPRTGKSELISRRLPGFIFGRNPNAKVIACSYNADLAHAMNRDVQRIMLSEEYGEVFPNTCLNKNRVTSDDQNWKRSAEEFEIVGHRGYYKCAGVGGGITGRGGKYLLVDDPIRGRQDADSETGRMKLWEWFQDDLKTRLEGDGGILIVATRWHESDLSGMLITKMKEDEDADQWEVLSLPVRLDEPGHAEDPRGLGEVLWPWFYAGAKDHYSREQMEHLAFDKVRLWEHNNPRGFASLGQQQPAPREGSMFKVERMETVHATHSKRVKTIRFWDKAGTEGGGKYTCGLKMSKLENGKFIVEDVVRGQWSALRREETILDTARMDGHSVQVWFEQEPGSGGKESAEATVRNLAGFIVKADLPRGSKETRAELFSAQMEGGNVLMLHALWNQSYKEELRFFPNGAFTDQVDASSGAFNKLAAQLNYAALTKM